MKSSYRLITAIAFVAASALAAAGVTSTQSAPEVTIQVPRIVKADPGQIGSPYDVILTGRVSYSDLDLSRTADAVKLEQRIKEKAHVLCERIGKDYPATTPNTEDCARIAASKALVQAKRVVDAAAKRGM